MVDVWPTAAVAQKDARIRATGADLGPGAAQLGARAAELGAAQGAELTVVRQGDQFGYKTHAAAH